MTTTTQVDRDQEAIDGVRESLLSGRTFALAAISHRSRRGYEPPVNHRDYAASMKVLARMAGESDPLAAVARAVFGRVNLYGTDSDAAAKLWEAAGEALRAGYTDVVGRAAPDAYGRRSSYERDYSLDERLMVWAYVQQAAAPFDKSTLHGYGWAFERLAKAERVYLPEWTKR